MTFHTRAATDEIYSIFNQPLKSTKGKDTAESGGESDFDDDDYTSAGESTGTGRVSGTSEFGDEQTEALKSVNGDDTELGSVSEWSEFTTTKHLPKPDEEDDTRETLNDRDNEEFTDEMPKRKDAEDLLTPVDAQPDASPAKKSKFIPIAPEDYQPPIGPYRDPLMVSQNRLPFMTPIVEKTESSLASTVVHRERDYFDSKTPSRKAADAATPIITEDTEHGEPTFENVIAPKEAFSHTILKDLSHTLQVDKKESEIRNKASKGPIIEDTQCNPVDDTIRATIFEKMQPPLTSYEGFFDRKSQTANRGAAIRRFTKALTKASSTKGSPNKTSSTLSIPPMLRFEGSERVYAIKRELGKGAFAPVYLAENVSDRGTNRASEDDEEMGELNNGLGIMGQGAFATCQRQELEAVKMEDPPTAWEFYMIRAAHRRLGVHRAAESIVHAHEMHLFADECFLVLDYRDQGTLLDLVNIARSEGNGMMDETLVMFLAVELFRTVETLHKNGILHGDLKADNCLVRFDSIQDADWSPQYSRDGHDGWRAKGFALIDFGRGIDMRAFRPDVQFIADWKTGPQDCVEMREMRPWTYQVDYFGLAGILHSLLFGKYIDTVIIKNEGESMGLGAGAGGKLKRYRIREGLKRYWQQDIWGEAFDFLLNPMMAVEREDTAKLPVLKGMREVRESMEEWLEANAEKRGLKGLIKKMEGRVGRGKR